MRSILFELGFSKSRSDSCVFYKENNGDLVIIGLYVDDLLILSDSIGMMNSIKSQINSRVTLSDKGPISQFLSLNIRYGREDGILLMNQSDYIKQTLEQFQMNKCNPKFTPILSGAELYEQVGNPLDSPEIYLSIVGCLIYLSTHPTAGHHIHHKSTLFIHEQTN